MIEMMDTCLMNESPTLLAFIEGEVLGVPVETEQLLILPADDGDKFVSPLSNDDVDGDGYPDPDIYIDGEFDMDGGGGGGGGGGTGGDGGQDMFNPDSGEGGGGSEQPTQEQPDCRDTAAVKADQVIEDRDDDHRREIGVLVYRDATGSIRTSEPIVGDGERIALSDVLNMMTKSGISFSQVVGFVHNHDDQHYAVGATTAEIDANRRINRYPSGNDWGFADYMVNNGSGGGNGFALYVIDTQGKMREFNYRDDDYYRGLTDTQKGVGTGLPTETQSGTCA